MRLTYKFSTAGVAGMAKMPMLAHEGKYYLTDGVLDEAKVRSELRDHAQVQFASTDNRAVISFAVEFMDRTKMSWNKLIESDCGVEKAKPTDKPTTVEKRMDRDQVCYVRVDIGVVQGAVRVRLSTANPRDTVGHTEQMAALVAQTMADTLTAIRDDLADMGCGVQFVEGEGCAGMFAASVERNRLAVLREQKRDCPNRLNGFCSPCVFDCPFYEKGMCRWR